MRKSANLKEAFRIYCERRDLRASYDYAPGCARLRTVKGRIVLEVTHAAVDRFADGTVNHRVGFAYPAGVKGMTDPEMVAWLRNESVQLR